MKYGFIGCGNMGSAIACALAKITNNIIITDRSGRAATLAEELGCTYADNETAAEKCDRIFLAVKPQMMKGMLAVVMAMSMAACSGAPAADQTSSESPSPAQTESTAATEQETSVTEVSAETQTQEETAKAPKYVFCLLVMV